MSASISYTDEQTESLTILVTALVRQQQWAEAERVSISIPDEEQKIGVLTILATSLAQQQQWADPGAGQHQHHPLGSLAGARNW